MKKPGKNKSKLSREVDEGYARFCKKHGIPLPKKWSAMPMAYGKETEQTKA
jgi:hypothetical protein